jgi:AcrR family transcriptional regulator
MAAKTSRFSPRKQPVQARSKATVAAIIEATAQVLVARGYPHTSTDAVAERAGVSIGTLYQYFPNKDALVAALIRDHVEQVLGTVAAAMNAHAAAPMAVALGAIVHASVEAHRINPALHKVVFEQVPRDQILGDILDAGGRLQQLIEAFLRLRVAKLPAKRVRIIALVLETSIEALTHRAVLEAPEWLRSGEIERETVALLEPYLATALA